MNANCEKLQIFLNCAFKYVPEQVVMMVKCKLLFNIKFFLHISLCI